MAASADEVQWAPIYVIGAGYKKVNGAWIGAGNYEGCLRYKNPKFPIWAFFSGDKKQWLIANKARYIEEAKCMYKNHHNAEAGSSIPFKGWKKGVPPGAMPAPKVISTSFYQGDKVECWSKKGKKWKTGSVQKVNESGTYKCKLDGVRKPINIGRQQIRMLNSKDTLFTDNQFVEINTKSGDWLPAMIGDVKDNGKYYIVLPDGKGANYSEEKIRPTELCRDGVETAVPKAGGNVTAVRPSFRDSKQTSSAKDDGEKDALISELQSRISSLEAELVEARKSKTPTKEAPASATTGLDPDLVSQIREKQTQLMHLAQDIKDLQERLFSN